MCQPSEASPRRHRVAQGQDAESRRLRDYIRWPSYHRPCVEYDISISSFKECLKVAVSCEIALMMLLWPNWRGKMSRGGVVRKRVDVHLLPSEYQTLLNRWDSLFLLDLLFYLCHLCVSVSYMEGQ